MSKDSKNQPVKVLILKQTVAAKKKVKVAEVHTLEPSEANFLIAIKKAAPYSEELEKQLKEKGAKPAKEK